MSAIPQIQSIKSDLTQTLQNEVGKIHEYLDQIEKPEKKLEYLLKLLPYILPKMGNMEAIEYDWHTQTKIDIF